MVGYDLSMVGYDLTSALTSGVYNTCIPPRTSRSQTMIIAFRFIKRMFRSSGCGHGERLRRYSTLAFQDSQPAVWEEQAAFASKVLAALSGMGIPLPKQNSLCSLCSLSKHFGVFRSLGIHADGLCKIISAYPQVLILDPDTDLKLSVSQLEAALGRSLLAECILSWPSLLGLGFPQVSARKGDSEIANHDFMSTQQALGLVQDGLRCSQRGLQPDFANHNLEPRVELDCSSQEAVVDSRSSMQDLGLVMRRQWIPQDEFAGKMDFLLKCGFKRNTKLLAKACFCALQKTKQDVDKLMHTLMSLGLSCNHARRLIRLQPPVLQQKPVEIGLKLDYILNTLRFSIEDLLKYSSFMLYDLDTHIRPRHLMHGWIKSKRLLRRNFKLDYIMSMSERQFISKFVECHENGLSMYHGFVQNGKYK